MDWQDWRAEFPILERRTYLNSCSLGALSRRAEASVRRFHDEWHAQGASAWYETWIGRLDTLRGRVAGMLNAAPAEIAFSASVSQALTVIASALDYARRPKIVVSALDFPTIAYQWMARPDAEVVIVPSDDGVTIDPARYRAAVDDRTALIATSHVYFTTGAIQDLELLAEIAHARGALLLVDAYQSTGQVPIDVARSGVDVLITGPLKWLLGGPGLAYLFVRDELVHRLVPTAAGWWGVKDAFDFDVTRMAFHDDARRFELGTPALPTVHAALGGQEIIDEIGVARIRERNAALTARLITAAKGAGFRVRCAAEPADRSAIIMIEEDDPAAAVTALDARGIVVDARAGCVRVSPHFYNTEKEVDTVVEALRELRS